jgi:imidazolonepropionase-like amidohydrolase
VRTLRAGVLLLGGLLPTLLSAQLTSGNPPDLWVHDADTIPGPALALVGATILDGTGAPPVFDGVVVTDGARLSCVGSPSDCPIPDGAQRVDVSGHWIVPGLIDAHVHFSQTGWADGRPDALDLRLEHPYPEAMALLRDRATDLGRSYLCSGVTAVFDVGGYPWSWSLREPSVMNPWMPRVAAAGPLLSTRDHWLNLPAERQFLYMGSRDAVREATDYLLSFGTDAVKVWFLPATDPGAIAEQQEYLGLAARWSRGAGTPLIVHATHLEGALNAVSVGAHLLVHSVDDRLVDDEFLTRASAAGVIYTPTLTVPDGYTHLRERRFEEGALGTECIDPWTLALVRETPLLPGRPTAEALERGRVAAEERRERMFENLRRVHAAGIPVAVGTDAGNPLTLHGPSIFVEMEAMQAAGLAPGEVLRAATLTGARAMRLETEIGTLEPGKVADLLVLSRDPLIDVANLRSIRRVMRAGHLHSREELVFHHGGRD